jgi:hypothetical protein
MHDREQRFRKQALKRAVTADNLERPMAVVGGEHWLMTAVLGARMILVVVWLVVGRAPTIAAGRGVILRPRQVVDAESAGNMIATVDQSEINAPWVVPVRSRTRTEEGSWRIRNSQFPR